MNVPARRRAHVFHCRQLFDFAFPLQTRVPLLAILSHKPTTCTHTHTHTHTEFCCGLNGGIRASAWLFSFPPRRSTPDSKAGCGSKCLWKLPGERLYTYIYIYTTKCTHTHTHPPPFLSPPWLLPSNPQETKALTHQCKISAVKAVFLACLCAGAARKARRGRPGYGLMSLGSGRRRYRLWQCCRHCHRRSNILQRKQIPPLFLSLSLSLSLSQLQG